MPVVENEEKTGRLHWIIFAMPASFLILAALVYLMNPLLWQPAVFFFVVGMSIGFMSMVSFRFTELVVTSSSLIIRKGLFTRQTLEIPFSQIESVDIIQRVFGQVFDYGSLIIVGTGSTQTVVQQLNHPYAWRETLQKAIAQARAR